MTASADTTTVTIDGHGSDADATYAGVLAARGALFAGMYEPAPSTRSTFRHAGSTVRLLNPGCDDQDPASRRFAQLEID
jgi:hypothetical protein